MTEIENFQKLMHLNQFSHQKHMHTHVWVILLQPPVDWNHLLLPPWMKLHKLFDKIHTASLTYAKADVGPPGSLLPLVKVIGLGAHAP
jgi:hypothetical protein